MPSMFSGGTCTQDFIKLSVCREHGICALFVLEIRNQTSLEYCLLIHKILTTFSVRMNRAKLTFIKLNADRERKKEHGNGRTDKKEEEDEHLNLLMHFDGKFSIHLYTHTRPKCKGTIIPHTNARTIRICVHQTKITISKLCSLFITHTHTQRDMRARIRAYTHGTN